MTPDVLGRAVQHQRQHRILETGVVAEQHHIGAGVDDQPIGHLLGPSDDHALGLGEALLGGEDRPGVVDDHPEPQPVGHPAQLLCDVNGAEDHQPGLGGHRLYVDMAAPVGQGAVLFPVHEMGGVGNQVIGNVLGDGPGDEAFGAVQHPLGADAGAVHDGHHRPQPFGLDEAAHRFQRTHHFSTNTWIVPPQASPTSKASSSAIP